ncbi:hypothetical protein GW17_00015312 [Ensete ventricosum]|nr:hypothetical protein GW17_00015312 [Ensete ventricosum]
MGGQPRPVHLQGGGQLWLRPHAKGRLAAIKAPYTGGGRLWPAHRGGRRLRGPAHKGLLARDEVVRAMPAHCQAAMVGCPWRGHRGSTRRLNRGSNDGAEREEEDLGHFF